MFVCVCSNCYIICVCLCVCHAGWNSPQALDSMSLPEASNLTSSTWCWDASHCVAQQESSFQGDIYLCHVSSVHTIITPHTQHINIINPITYQIHNNPTFEIADHPAPSSQRRPQRKRRCEILNIPHNLPSLNLTPLRTAHIQQELWTYKKDKAFSMTPTEAINTLYYDDMDILHIDNWRFFTPKKRDRWYTPKTETITMPLWILKDGPYPSLNQLD